VRDPTALLDQDGSSLDLSLLRAGDAEQPTADARNAAMAALGLSAGVVALSAASVAPAAAAASGSAATWLAKLSFKWWLLGALGTVAAVGTGYRVLLAPRQPAPHSSTAERQLPPAAPTPMLSSSVPYEAALPVAQANASLAPLRAAPNPRAAPASSSTAGIQDQIALIDRARSALASGKSGAALDALDTYRKRYPKGVLGQEATMLSIEALLAQGENSAAKLMGDRFLARYPRSALASRVRLLLGK